MNDRELYNEFRTKGKLFWIICFILAAIVFKMNLTDLLNYGKDPEQIYATTNKYIQESISNLEYSNEALVLQKFHEKVMEYLKGPGPKIQRLIYICIFGFLPIWRVFKQNSPQIGKILTIYSFVNVIFVYGIRNFLLPNKFFCIISWILTSLSLTIWLALLVYYIVKRVKYKPMSETTFLSSNPVFYDILVLDWFLLAAAIPYLPTH